MKEKLKALADKLKEEKKNVFIKHNELAAKENDYLNSILREIEDLIK